MTMNQRGHFNFTGLMFLVLIFYIVAALIEGALIALFWLATFKWKLCLLSVLLGIVIVIFPLSIIKKVTGYRGPQW